MSRGRETVLRFDATERWLHWAFSIPFLVTIVTGIGLYFSAFERLLGNREMVRVVHRAAAVGVVVLPLLVLALGNRRRLRADARAVDVWSADDRRWARGWLLRRVGGRDDLPPAGRFNAGQKFNAVLTAAATFWLVVSGILVYPGIHPPFWLVSNSRVVHDMAALFATLAVAGHIFLAAIYRPTRPGLAGMITGRVDAAWLRAHHPLAPELGVAPGGDAGGPGAG